MTQLVRITVGHRRGLAWLLLFAGSIWCSNMVCAQSQEKLPDQIPTEVPKPMSAPAIPGSPVPASIVFPDGGFSASQPTAENPVPTAIIKPDLSALAPAQLATEIDSGRLEYLPPDGLAPSGVPEVFRPVSDLLPPYFYRQSYYEQLVGAPIAGTEYAPPGYEAREYQSAPGVPEFTLITPPVPITAEERQKFVTRGPVPGSYLVPGTNTSFRFRGFVRLTGIYDYKPIGTPDIFVTNTIPVPQQSGQNTNASARPSRIATETWTPTSFLDWTVHTFIEADFFNGPGQAAGGGGNPFRLRHAFVDFGYFRVGQQNSVFMDGSTWPSLVDFQGPAGWVNQRRPGARILIPFWDKFSWATGIEQPFSDITTNSLGAGVQDVPDFATNLRYEGDFGHVQLAGLARSIGYQPNVGDTVHKSGYGFSVGTTFHPWACLIGSNPLRKENPTGLERCRIIGQYTAGRGIGRYELDTVGLGLDGQVDPLTGLFNVINETAWLVSYEHWFTERWMAQGTWSETQVGHNGFQPGSTYAGAKYAAVSLWYIPFRNMSLGLEQLFGERENLDGQRGRAQRLNGLVQYNF